MTAARDVRITVEGRDRDRVLLLKNIASGEEAHVPLTPRVLDALKDWRKNLPSALGPFHQAAGKIRKSRQEERWALINTAATKLRDIGLELLNYLTGNGARAIGLQEFFDRVVPLSRRSPTQPMRLQLIVGETDEELLTLPIEYLPLGSIPERFEIKDPVGLQKALTMHAGFAAIVVHRLDRGTARCRAGPGQGHRQ
jgi:hypothetical protein